MTPLRAHRLLRLAVRLGARMRYMERPSSFTVGAVRGLCTSTSGKSKPDKANEHDETFTSTVELKGKKGGSQAEEKSAWTKFWDREMERREEAKKRKSEGWEKLNKDMSRSQLQDYYDMQRKRGKAEPAIKEIIPKSKAIAFPSMVVHGLDGSTFDLSDNFANEVTWVTMYGTALAMQMGQEWLDEISGEGIQIYEVSVNESWFSRLLKPLSLRGLKNRVPVEKHANFATVFGSIAPQVFSIP
ncbi:hypothetical protein AAMO2058_001339500 [Amorphochlora amoebiformis]